MSTPTTAAAPLSHYHPHAHYPYQHHHAGYQTNGTSSYRAVAANGLLPAASSSRLPPYSSVGYSTPLANGLSGSQSSSRPPETAASSSQRSHTRRLSEMQPANSQPSQRRAAAQSQSTSASRRRRRSRDPDWSEFYRNGLPKEVIVIDDTPEPETQPTRKRVNGATNGASHAVAGQATKKRKRDDEANGKGYKVITQANTPHGQSTPSGSTISTDRTAHGVYNTASTSLSSNGHYEDSQVGQKRKRTTRRQAAASEAKRRELEVAGNAMYTYKPPPLPPKKAPTVHVKQVSDHHYHERNIKVDDDDGHYIVIPDTDLTSQFRISKVLGQGTFGKVVEAREKKTGKAVAIKIIRSVQKYRDASTIELRVLQTLKMNDEENRNRCIHLRDCFDYRGHICIVMDLLGQSVFDFLKINSFVPFPNSHIQNFARQLFTSVAYLHDLNLIHTDLKPENILLCDDSYQTFTYNRRIPCSSTPNGAGRSATQRKVLLDTEIRLIDFGSATFQDEYHSSVVSTRHYRAPEIILGLGWTFPCDIWSIGCILVEFYTGDALFQTHDNLEHLAMMEAVVGSRIDTQLVTQVNRQASRNSGNGASKYFKRLKLDYPTAETSRMSKKFVKAMKQLEDIIPANTTFLKNFVDLLKRIFVYDPLKRISAKEALRHPWFQELAPPDDGTEAGKIRQERMRMEMDMQHQRHLHRV